MGELLTELTASLEELQAMDNWISSLNREDCDNPIKERFVLFADIMGFKDFVQRTPILEAQRRIIQFRKSFDKECGTLARNLRIAFFSDSILVITQAAEEKDLNLVSKAGAILMRCAFKAGFAIKGCLAQGMFNYDPTLNIYFGQPLIDAYLLEEDLKYYGIAVHHSAEQAVKEKAGDNPYIYSPIPLRTGRICHCHLAWNLYQQKPIENLSYCDKWLCDMEKTVSGAPRVYIDNTRAVLQQDLSILQSAENSLAEAKKLLKERECVLKKQVNLPITEYQKALRACETCDKKRRQTSGRKRQSESFLMGLEVIRSRMLPMFAPCTLVIENARRKQERLAAVEYVFKSSVGGEDKNLAGKRLSIVSNQSQHAQETVRELLKTLIPSKKLLEEANTLLMNAQEDLKRLSKIDQIAYTERGECIKRRDTLKASLEQRAPKEFKEYEEAREEVDRLKRPRSSHLKFPLRS